MSAAFVHPRLLQESGPVALELYAFLRELDPSRWRDGLEAAWREKAAQIEARLSCLLTEARERSGLHEHLAELAQLLRERVPAPELSGGEARARWASLRAELNRAYESLCLFLEQERAQADVLPSVRPTNYTRSTFHFGISLVAILLIEHVLPYPWRGIVPLSVALLFWSLEGLRRVNETTNAILVAMFRHIVHPHERFRFVVNSSTWYASALAILGLFFSLPACVAALAVIGVADPLAALVGRRWGRRRLAAERTLEGTITFVIAGTLAAFAALRLWHPALALGVTAAVAGAAALVGAAAEVASSRRLDDNFTVPVAAAVAGAAALHVLV